MRGGWRRRKAATLLPELEKLLDSDDGWPLRRPFGGKSVHPSQMDTAEALWPPGSEIWARVFQLVVNGKFLNPPEGVSARNFHASSVHRFHPTRKKRTITIDELVIHETQTSTVAGTIKVLAGKGASVHMIVAPDGSVTQHADLLVRTGHAEPHNTRSVGIEIVNPYVKSRLRKPWTGSLDNPKWSTGGYVLPTRAQAETVALLVQWLTGLNREGVSIPRNWIGLHPAKRFAMSLVGGAGDPGPGVYAHTYFCPTRPSKRCPQGTNLCRCKHADGAWPVLYSWLRIEAGLNAGEAYTTAVALAQKSEFRRINGAGGHWIDLPAKLFPHPLPPDHDCVAPRVRELELEAGSSDGCRLVPISPTPSPGFFYTIKYKIDGRGLLDLAGRAYGVSPGGTRMTLAQRINNHPYNHRFWRASLSSQYFPQGRISFSPRFTSNLQEQRNAKGAAPFGRSFATIFIPPRAGNI